MSRPLRRSGSVERVVHANPADIYRVIADVTSTGDRSSECYRVEWLPDGPGEAIVGARFRGYNRSRLLRWHRVCEITEAVPGEVFAFRTVPERLDPSRRDSTIWRYELVGREDGTLVRHSYEITQLPLPPFKALYGILFPHHRDLRPAMRETLDALAQQLETTAAVPTVGDR